MNDPIQDQVNAFEFLCTQYSNLKKINDRTEEEENIYQCLKKRLKADIPDEVYLNAFNRMKSDYIVLRSCKKIKNSMMMFMRSRPIAIFHDYLQFVITLIQSHAFDFLNLDTMKTCFRHIVQLLKVGDTEDMTILTRFLPNISGMLFSNPQRGLTATTLLTEINQAFMDNKTGKAIMGKNILLDKREIFQLRILPKIFLMTVTRLTMLPNEALEVGSSLYTLRENLLLLLLSMLRYDYRIDRLHPIYDKIITTKVKRRFIPPESWTSMINSLAVFPILFRILKHGSTDMYTELLIITCITQYSTLQLSTMDSSLVYSTNVDHFLVRFSEIIDRFGHMMKPKSLLYMTNAFKMFHRSTYIKNSVEIQAVKSMMHFDHHKSIMKLFDIIMKNASEALFKDKKLNKALYFFFSYIRDLKKVLNSFKIYNITMDTVLYRDMFDNIFKTFISYILIKPFGRIPVGRGSINQVNSIKESGFENPIKQKNYKLKDFVKKISTIESFIKAIFDSLKKLMETLFTYISLKEFVPIENLLHTDSFLDFLENLRMMLKISKHIFSETFWNNKLDFRGKYIVLFDFDLNHTIAYINSFLEWNKATLFNPSPPFLIDLELKVEPFIGIYVLVFIISRLMLKIVDIYGYHEFMSRAFKSLLKCHLNISTMSDDLFKYDLTESNIVGNNVELPTPMEITQHRGEFCIIAIQDCYSCYEIFSTRDFKKCIICINVIKNTIKYSSYFILQEQLFFQSFQDSLEKYVKKVYKLEKLESYHVLSDLCGLYFYVSFYLANQNNRDYAYSKLGEILRIHEVKDYYNMILINQNPSYENQNICRSSRISFVAGVIGVARNFPREIYYTEKYRKLIEYFIKPISDLMPSLWECVTGTSAFIQHYALFCIEIISLYAFFDHKKIEIVEYLKMIYLTTWKYKKLGNEKYLWVSAEETEKAKTDYRLNLALMMTLGSRLIEFLQNMKYTDETFPTAQIHEYLHLSIQNILHGIIFNITLHYIYAENLLYTFCNFTASYMTPLSLSPFSSLDHFEIISNIVIHGMGNKSLNHKLFTDCIDAMITMMCEKQNNYPNLDCSIISSNLFFYMFYRILMKTSEKEIIIKIFIILMKMLNYYYDKIKLTLDDILSNSKLSVESVQEIVKKTIQLKNGINFKSGVNYDYDKCFNIFTEWLILFKNEAKPENTNVIDVKP